MLQPMESIWQTLNGTRDECAMSFSRGYTSGKLTRPSDWEYDLMLAYQQRTRAVREYLLMYNVIVGFIFAHCPLG
jgi:hypothetical protein